MWVVSANTQFATVTDNTISGVRVYVYVVGQHGVLYEVKW